MVRSNRKKGYNTSRQSDSLRKTVESERVSGTRRPKEGAEQQLSAPLIGAVQARRDGKKTPLAGPKQPSLGLACLKQVVETRV